MVYLKPYFVLSVLIIIKYYEEFKMNNKKSVGRINEVRVDFSVGINYMDAHKYLQ